MPEDVASYTAEQEDVLALGTDARAIVDASAGTGKTHVLAGRLARLIDRDGLSAGDEILVLSFSRAAVSELRSRVARLGGDARYVGATTFDAFATQLLASEQPDGSWLGRDYDARIRAAIDLLKGPRTPQLLIPMRHILVDEVQDLVGLRASMVIALLSRVGAGFTLFGDPAQAIYGHRGGTDAAGPTNPEFYTGLAEAFGDKLSRWTLSRDFRGRTDHASTIAHIGSWLRESHPDHLEIASDLRSLILRLPATTLGAAKRVLTSSDHGTSAVLCRTNAEALRISQDLFERAVPHRYQRRGEDKAAGGWLSRTLTGVTEVHTTRSSLMPRLAEVAAEQGTTAEELFTLIRRLDPARGDGIDLLRVANRLREASFPEELNGVVPAPVVVSTIHRAKGLEFDRVLLCDSEPREDSDLGEGTDCCTRTRLLGMRGGLLHLQTRDQRPKARPTHRPMDSAWMGSELLDGVRTRVGGIRPRLGASPRKLAIRRGSPRSPRLSRHRRHPGGSRRPDPGTAAARCNRSPTFPHCSPRPEHRDNI